MCLSNLAVLIIYSSSRSLALALSHSLDVVLYFVAHHHHHHIVTRSCFSLSLSLSLKKWIIILFCGCSHRE
jgi:hypothetical protein